jgi:hypothetical protein
MRSYILLGKLILKMKKKIYSQLPQKAKSGELPRQLPAESK